MNKFKKFTALALSALLVGTTAVFAACSDNEGEEEIEPANQETETTDYENSLSAASYNFDAEYFYSDYNSASNAEGAEGIDVFENKDIVFETVYYDQLNYILNSEGTYLFLFGGSWCHNTRAAIGYINEFAKAYGVDTVYNFDFRLDGETSATHIRESTATPQFGGEGTKTAADFSYLYGELVERYLTNLNDWVEYTEDSRSALTWYDVAWDKHVDAKVQVPFLFLYNKDNTTRYYYDEEGTIQVDDTTDGVETYPIILGYEKMVDRDANGVYITNSATREKEYITDEYKAELKTFFNFIVNKNIKLSYYSDADYIIESFEAGNGRGHAAKLYDIFEVGDQININVITYRQLKWLFEQEGSAIILFGGAWCANTTAAIHTINDYAVANDLTVYMWDTRLDGKYPIDFWGYGRARQFQTRGTNQESTQGVYKDADAENGYSNNTENPFAYLYVDLINTYLTNIETINNPTSASFSDGNKVVSYIDADGNEVVAAKAQVPYLFSYNKDAKDADGDPAPVLAWYEQMLETNIGTSKFTKDLYFYTEENYTTYSNGVFEVIKAYAATTGDTAVEYTGAPAHPFVNFDLLG